MSSFLFMYWLTDGNWNQMVRVSIFGLCCIALVVCCIGLVQTMRQLYKFLTRK
jgi:hypothetical protein